MSKIKKIVFIPPGGKIYLHDFSIKRIANYLTRYTQVKTVLIKMDTTEYEDILIDTTISVQNKQELFDAISKENPDYIFHRSWMHGYPFAAELVEKFDNVIVNIKDWNFSNQEEYKVIFGENNIDDFDAIEYIFKKAKLILSHYSDEQAEIWGKEYCTDEKRFKFFPEYCDENKFYVRDNIDYTNPKIVYAGSMCPTSFTEEQFPCKAYLRSIRVVTKDGLDVSYVLIKSAYEAIQDPKRRDLFLDILYEDKFNPYFHIKEGKTHDPLVLQEYHFAFFHLEDSAENQGLTKYAVPSKFAFYLEAGVPILINSKMKAISNLVIKYNLGVVFSNSEIGSLAHRLKNITNDEYNEYIKNIKLFRNSFTYKNKIESIFEIN
jgi:hypothetical protein